MRLPLLVSVPHAGEEVPPEVEDICTLTKKEIREDGDGGAAAIYQGLEGHCREYVSTGIARAIVDLNRAPDDIGGDGVIKTHTCWNIPVYRSFPDNKLVRLLLGRHYFPYHERLSAAAGKGSVRLGIDCHTMAAKGPPVGPDPGQERPLVCLSNGDNTCPDDWIKSLAEILASLFREEVSINRPFRGGYITRHHAAEMPWLQIELSRTPSYSDAFKGECVLAGLQRFCHSGILD
jgi:formiminoglutamase